VEHGSGTFSGLFVANYPIWSQNFPFCSLYALAGVALSALMYLKNLERAAGIEPATYSLGSCRSTTELRPQLFVEIRRSYCPAHLPAGWMPVLALHRQPSRRLLYLLQCPDSSCTFDRPADVRADRLPAAATTRGSVW
jgi:hypothetical protein